MKTIEQIYADYNLMPTLRLHQYRAAAVAKMVCDNFKDEVDTETVIMSCLFHDMGNIIKFELDKFPKFLQPEGLDYWTSVQQDYFNRYGLDEHEATFKIIEELGINRKVVENIDRMGFSKSKENVDAGVMEAMIAEYADMRVSPRGVVSLQQRLDDIKARYAHRLKEHEKKISSEVLITALHEIEKRIFEKCSIRPEDINDTSTEEIINKLHTYKIICNEASIFVGEGSFVTEL